MSRRQGHEQQDSAPDGLGRVLADVACTPSPVPASADAALFEALESSIAAHDRAPLATLRDLGTPVRVAAAISCVALAMLGVATTALRHDVDAYPAWRLAAEFIALFAILIASIAIALRSLTRPSLRAPALAVTVAVSLAVPLLIAVLPGGGRPMSPIPRETLGPLTPAHWSAGLPCMWFGIAVGVCVYAASRVFDRSRTRAPWLAVAAAGVAANMALVLHCPSPDVAHKLTGHASIGFVFLACLSMATAIDAWFTRARR